MEKPVIAVVRVLELDAFWCRTLHKINRFCKKCRVRASSLLVAVAPSSTIAVLPLCSYQVRTRSWG